jgi:hypothetical protein
VTKEAIPMPTQTNATNCPDACDHAVCAWCRMTFATVLMLISHAEAGH